MGSSASVQSAVTNITNKIKSQIDQSAASESLATCKVSIEDINYENCTNCSIEIKNACYSDSKASVSIMNKVIAEFYNKLENNQKQEAASWFTATVGVSSNVNNLVNDYSNYINQECTSKAMLESTIKIKSINVKDCNGPSTSPVKFQMINSGTASGLCAMEIFNNIVSKGVSDIVNTQAQGMNWGNLIWPICIAIIVIAIVYIALTFFTRIIPSSEDRISLEKAKKDNYSTRIQELLSYLRY